MIPLDFERTVDTELAPDGLIPVMVDMPSTHLVRGHQFRFEPWRLSDGQVYVIVRAADEDADLAESADGLDEWVRFRWGAEALIIEDWRHQDPRYTHRTAEGRREQVDAMALRRRGMLLSRVLPFRPGVD